MATLTTVFDTRNHQFVTEEEVPSSTKGIAGCATIKTPALVIPRQNDGLLHSAN